MDLQGIVFYNLFNKHHLKALRLLATAARIVKQLWCMGTFFFSPKNFIPTCSFSHLALRANNSSLPFRMLRLVCAHLSWASQNPRDGLE